MQDRLPRSISFLKDYSRHKFVADILAGIPVGRVTLALTVLADLTSAVDAGMFLAALVQIRKVTATTTVHQVT